MPLSLPPHAYETRASWVDLPAGCADTLAEAGLGEQLEAGLHAAAHALLAVLPLHLSCEPGDVGCECNALRKASQLRRGGPQRLLLFDRCTCMLCARCVHSVCTVCARCTHGVCTVCAHGAYTVCSLLLLDRCEGGIGIAARLHGRMAPLLRTALEMATACPCRDGCWCRAHAAPCNPVYEGPQPCVSMLQP